MEENKFDGNNRNILGRNLISLCKDYNIKILENFNIIIIDEKKDLEQKNIEYRNCIFHILTLKEQNKYNFQCSITDTVNLNFINLSLTNQADYILFDIINFNKKDNNLKFLDYKIFSNFIIENIPEKNILIKDNLLLNLGSTLYIPKELKVINNINKKIKLDLYPFSNNYNVVGLNIDTNYNDCKIFLDKNILLLNKNIDFEIF